MFEDLGSDPDDRSRELKRDIRNSGANNRPVILIGVVIAGLLLIVAGIMIWQQIEKSRAESDGQRLKTVRMELGLLLLDQESIEDIAVVNDRLALKRKPVDPKTAEKIKILEAEEKEIFERWPNWRGHPERWGLP